MKNPYDIDYFTNGKGTGKSCYENYRWLPELTYPLTFAVVNELGLSRRSTILEYGCAHGYMLRCLSDFGFEVRGMDVSEYALSQVQPTLFDKVRLIEGPPSNDDWHFLGIERFDWTISKDVFEHIPKNQLKLTLSELAKRSDHLYAIVPLGDSGKYRIPEYHQDPTHVIAEDEDWWKNIFDECDWKLQELKHRVSGVKDYWQQMCQNGNGFFKLSSKVSNF